MTKRLIAYIAVTVGLLTMLAAAGAVDGEQIGAGQVFVTGVAGLLAVVTGILALAQEEEGA